MATKKTLKLKIDMVPQGSWGTSLRNGMPRSRWDKLRKQVHDQNGNKCQICDSTVKLNCHELWEYDAKSNIQKLVGLGTICNMCHHVTHIGRSIQLDREGHLDIDAVVNHFLKVNGCDPATFKRHFKKEWAVFIERSSHEWQIDFGEYAHLLNKNAS